MLVGIALLMAITTGSASAWTTDGVQVIAPGSANTINPFVRSVIDQTQALPADGGGMWIAWSDNRAGASGFDIYVQKLNSSGTQQFSSGGVAVCNASGDQVRPRIARDNSGGLLVCWEDGRNSGSTGVDVYCQDITGTGSVASGWPTNGVVVAQGTSDQIEPVVTADASTGAIVFYIDEGYAPEITVGKRITGSGSVWSRLVYNGGEDFKSPTDAAPDGAGGAVCAFQAGANGALLAQHVDASGNLLWTRTGGSDPLTAPPVVSNGGWRPRIAYDGVNGAYVADNLYVGSVELIEASHVDQGGGVASVFQSTSSSGQFHPEIVAGPEGDAFIAWSDERNGSCHCIDDVDFYAARLSSNSLCSGWVVNGLRVTDASAARYNLTLAPSGDGGGVLVWEENGNIYARDVRPNATLDSQVTLCSATGAQTNPAATLTSKGVVSAAWIDPRSGSGQAIYAQQTTLTPAPGMTSVTTGSVGALGIDVHWTVPSSNANFGAPVQFDVRESSGGITEKNFESLPSVGYFTAGSSGSAMCATAVPLHRCFQYQFAIRTQYQCGVWSVLSNIPSAATLCSGNSVPDCGGGFMTATLPEGGPSAPAELEFAAPRPNPSQTSAQFRIGIPNGSQGEELRLAVFDAGGRRIRQLSQSAATAGWQTVEWDLLDDAGKRVPGGVYFAHLVAGGQRLARTLIVKP